MKKDINKINLDLMRKFLNNVEGIDLNGIPAPHIPVIGELYKKSKYKIAFYGIETKGWGNLEEFQNKFKNNEQEAFDYLSQDYKELDFLYWTNNFGTQFFNYVLLFLAKFYNISDWKLLRSEEKYQYILKTFIWGNTNSIERYEVTAKPNGVDFQNWEVIKGKSRIFDTAKHILDTCRPDVVLMLNWGESSDWLDVKDVKLTRVADHIEYAFLKDTGTHFYKLPHPRWIAPNMGFEKNIDIVINDLLKKGIHLKEEAIDQHNLKIEYNNINDKHEYIALLAQFLTANNMKMSGSELANHINRNGFKTSYGAYYKGGRGTYKLIRSCYLHFEKERKDLSDAIALAFVKENGEYAYL